MRLALKGLALRPEFVLVDGRGIPELELPQEPWIKGDANCHAIAAASILPRWVRSRYGGAVEELAERDPSRAAPAEGK